MKTGWVVMFGLASMGCGGPVATDEPTPTSATGAASQGLTLVYTHELGDREVEFYLGPNRSFGTIERATIDSQPSVTAPVDGVPAATLSELFLRVAPEQKVPKQLIDADVALELRAKVNSVAPTQLDEVPLAEPSQVRSGPCSGDLYGDNYGQPWFVDNHCYVVGGISECWPSRDYGKTLTANLHMELGNPAELYSAIFNGNFTATANYGAQYWTGSAWTGYASGTLAPREVWWIHWYNLRWSLTVANNCPDSNSAAMTYGW